jgi:hypothetical protein
MGRDNGPTTFRCSLKLGQSGLVALFPSRSLSKLIHEWGRAVAPSVDLIHSYACYRCYRCYGSGGRWAQML